MHTDTHDDVLVEVVLWSWHGGSHVLMQMHRALVEDHKEIHVPFIRLWLTYQKPKSVNASGSAWPSESGFRFAFGLQVELAPKWSKTWFCFHKKKALDLVQTCGGEINIQIQMRVRIWTRIQVGNP